MSIVFNNNENILHAYTQSQVLFSRHNDTLKGVKMGKRTGKPMGRPSKYFQEIRQTTRVMGPD